MPADAKAVSRSTAFLVGVVTLIIGAAVSSWLQNDSIMERELAARLRSIEIDVTAIRTQIGVFMEQSKTWVSKAEHIALERRVDKLEDG